MASLRREGPREERGAPWLLLLVGALMVALGVIGWLALDGGEAESRLAMDLDAPSLAPALPDIDGLPKPDPLPLPKT